MRRFFPAVAVVCCLGALNLFAADKEEVIQLNDRYFRSWVTADLNSVLAVAHPEFTHVTGGFTVNHQQLEFVASLYDMMEKLQKPEAGLVDFLLFAMITQGGSLSAAQRKHFTELEKTPKGQEMLRQMRAKLLQETAARKEKAAQAEKLLAKRRLVSCTGDGEKISVVIALPPAKENEKEEVYTCEWVKVDGKWLIKSCITTAK